MPKDRIQDCSSIQNCRTGRERQFRGPLLRAALGAALAAAVICADSAVARAGGDDDGQPFYAGFLSALGLKSSGDNINYSERSPLVVPPTRDLPPPGAEVPPAVADWPKDPDLTASAHARAKQKVEPNHVYGDLDNMPLRPSQLNVPGTRAARPGAAGGNSSSDYPEQDMHEKRSIFSFDWFKKEQYATFTGEPARTTLTDPPPGYMTPSPDQPYGVGPAQSRYKVPTIADRVEPTR
jgi:hypothetical protein